RFINVPELMQMFRQVADVQTGAMLDLPRPKLYGEKPAIRNAPATPELKAFVQELAARAERLKTGRVDPSEDNMLKITSEGRKAALDLRLGSGTNVQERLIALHHLDAPWRPADVEQREGRILRQGNKNSVVQIYRYVTVGSFDSYMWQTLESKAKFIHQVMSGDTTLRRLEDVDG